MIDITEQKLIDKIIRLQKYMGSNGTNLAGCHYFVLGEINALRNILNNENYFKDENVVLPQANVSGLLPNLCNHWFVQRDMYWQQCRHCGLEVPVRQ